MDNAASGTNAGTSWTNAWQSFADIAWGSVAGGDTVYISGGSTSKTYSELLDVGASGSSGNIITVTTGVDANHTGAVIIDTQGVRNGISLSSDDYITVGGTSSNNWQILNLEGTGSSGHGVYFSASDYDTVQYITMPSIDSRTGAFINSGTNLTLRYLTISTDTTVDSQADAIYGQNASNIIIEFCDLLVQDAQDAQHNDAVQFYLVNDWTIRNNTLKVLRPITTAHGIPFHSQGSDGSCYFYNNVVRREVTSGLAPIVSFENTTYAGTGTFYAYNNTVRVTSSSEVNLLYLLDDSGDMANHIVKNNIFWRTTGTGCLGNISAGVTPSNIDNNIWYSTAGGTCIANLGGNQTWAQWQAAGYDANGYNVDPDLDANYAPDAADDPEVDTGTTIALFSNDRDGGARPQGAAWDIGAYEFEATPSPTHTITGLNCSGCSH